MADNSKPGAVKLFQAVNVLESLYPLEYAESWDNPGLIAGDLFWDVKKIRFAVDPTYETVAEAIEEGTDLLICHHPLFFRSVHQVSGQGFRGDIINRLIEVKCALWVGHTNADAAVRGQADAAAFALGLKNCEALVPIDEKKVRPADAGKPVGIGRVGYLETEMTLRQFAVRVHEVLQSTQAGIRVAGDLEAKISKVAVLPGSGDSEFDAVRVCGADVYVTSDLRHHPVVDAMQQAQYEARLRNAGIDAGSVSGSSAKDSQYPSPAFIDTAHSAIERMWFSYAKNDVPNEIEKQFGFRPQISVSELVTDPWVLSIR